MVNLVFKSFVKQVLKNEIAVGACKKDTDKLKDVFQINSTFNELLKNCFPGYNLANPQLLKKLTRKYYLNFF